MAKQLTLTGIRLVLRGYEKTFIQVIVTEIPVSCRVCALGSLRCLNVCVCVCVCACSCLGNREHERCVKDRGRRLRIVVCASVRIESHFMILRLC